MQAEYDVRIWTIKPRMNKKGKVTSYSVRWRVGKGEFYESFKKWAPADGFRSELLSARNRGEPFNPTTGQPVSVGRRIKSMGWFELTCEYIALNWPDAAATTRQTTAEALIRVTPTVFLSSKHGRPSDREIRSVLRGWAYNADRQKSPDMPDDARRVMSWCARHSRPVSAVHEPETMRALQKAVTTRLDGVKYAPTVARKTRTVVSSVLDLAVEKTLLESNPLTGVKWSTMPKGNRAVDPRSVPNPVQARTLLAAVRDIQRSGPRLEAFFATMYFAALRPEEVVGLTEGNLKLPDSGWGEIYVEEAHPHAGSHWTGTGKTREVRALKARNVGEGRPVPCPPELTTLLRKHIARYEIGVGGLVFTGEKGRDIPLITYTRVWRAARAAAFTERVRLTPLAGRPYDLRHAAVSTWLAAGVSPPTVARWAGHSVAVLWEIYASCLHGQDLVARKQVEDFLGGSNGHRGTVYAHCT